jgi:hypothetical protein
LPSFAGKIKREIEEIELRIEYMQEKKEHEGHAFENRSTMQRN